MKFLSLIFAFCIGGLIVQPSLSILTNHTESQEVCDDQCCSEIQSCNDNSCKDEKNNENTCCPGGICNPFESCACCFGVSIAKPVVEITESVININYIQPKIKKVNFGYSTDCFRPPETV